MSRRSGSVSSEGVLGPKDPWNRTPNVLDLRRALTTVLTHSTGFNFNKPAVPPPLDLAADRTPMAGIDHIDSPVLFGSRDRSAMRDFDDLFLVPNGVTDIQTLLRRIGAGWGGDLFVTLPAPFGAILKGLVTLTQRYQRGEPLSGAPRPATPPPSPPTPEAAANADADAALAELRAGERDPYAFYRRTPKAYELLGQEGEYEARRR